MITSALALAAVVAFARPAAAQVTCSAEEGGNIVCGTVWNDLDGDGIQDADEPTLEGVQVNVYDSTGTMLLTFTSTDQFGTYGFDGSSLPPGTYIISIDSTQPPLGAGWLATSSNVGSDEFDSDGIDSQMGTSYYTLVIEDAGTLHDIDFGFFTKTATGPGTGTPGYWKNHPEAWPVSHITLGGVDYTKDQAIALLTKPGKDKRATLFSSLLSATLNVMIGNDSSCIQSTIDAANEWLMQWGVPNTAPIVTGDSAAWAVGEPLHKLMDAYNNGLLCAPHRN